MKPFFKLLELLQQGTKLRQTNLMRIFTITLQSKRTTKRGIKILWDILSWGTGIPSAEDHRQVLEQLNLLRLDSTEMKSIVASGTATNRALLRSFH